MSWNGNSRARGFTLIEILVALAILGLSLGVLMQIFSTGLRGAAASKTRVVATRLAESKLAAVGVEEPLAEGVSEGRFDERYRWRIAVRRLLPPDGEEPGAAALVRPYRVDVSVLWGGDGGAPGGDARSLTLTTLRLGPNE
jgi:general secretion pathway protein I